MIPPILVPCPPIHLVALSTTTSAPWSIGRIKAPAAPSVLSTINGMSYEWAKFAIASKSGTLISGLPIDSI